MNFEFPFGKVSPPHNSTETHEQIHACTNLGVGLEASLGLAKGESLILGLLLGLLLSVANHGDLRVCEASSGDVVVVHLRVACVSVNAVGIVS